MVTYLGGPVLSHQRTTWWRRWWGTRWFNMPIPWPSWTVGCTLTQISLRWVLDSNTIIQTRGEAHSVALDYGSDGDQRWHSIVCPYEEACLLGYPLDPKTYLKDTHCYFLNRVAAQITMQVFRVHSILRGYHSRKISFEVSGRVDWYWASFHIALCRETSQSHENKALTSCFLMFSASYVVTPMKSLNTRRTLAIVVRLYHHGTSTIASSLESRKAEKKIPMA